MSDRSGDIGRGGCMVDVGKLVRAASHKPLS
jgi:hypothetical protein